MGLCVTVYDVAMDVVACFCILVIHKCIRRTRASQIASVPPGVHEVVGQKIGKGGKIFTKRGIDFLTCVELRQRRYGKCLGAIVLLVMGGRAWKPLSHTVSTMHH